MSLPEVWCGLPVVLVEYGAGACGIEACVSSGLSVAIGLEADILGLEFLLGRCVVTVTWRKWGAICDVVCGHGAL